MRAEVLSVLAFAISPAAVAQPSPDVEVNEPVAGLIASLANDDRAGALGRIKGIFLMAEDSMLVASPEAFVERLIGCEANLEEARTNGSNNIYRFSWNCRDEYIEAWAAKDPEGTQVEVWDVVDTSMIANRATRRPGIPPPAPKPLTLDDI